MNRELSQIARIATLEAQLDAIRAATPAIYWDHEENETLAEAVSQLASDLDARTQHVKVAESIRDDYAQQLAALREKLAAYEAEAAALRALTPEAVLKAQELLERILHASFEGKREEPIVALDTLAAYMSRMRRSILAARMLFEDLDDPVCVACHESPCEYECQLWQWKENNFDTMLHHGLVAAPEAKEEA